MKILLKLPMEQSGEESLRIVAEPRGARLY